MEKQIEYNGIWICDAHTKCKQCKTTWEWICQTHTHWSIGSLYASHKQRWRRLRIFLQIVLKSHTDSHTDTMGRIHLIFVSHHRNAWKTERRELAVKWHEVYFLIRLESTRQSSTKTACEVKTKFTLKKWTERWSKWFHFTEYERLQNKYTTSISGPTRVDESLNEPKEPRLIEAEATTANENRGNLHGNTLKPVEYAIATSSATDYTAHEIDPNTNHRLTKFACQFGLRLDRHKSRLVAIDTKLIPASVNRRSSPLTLPPKSNEIN